MSKIRKELTLDGADPDFDNSPSEDLVDEEEITT